MNTFKIPIPLLTDSYKTTHYDLYPDSKKMVAYGEFRTSYEKDKDDQRIVYYGIRYILENYINIKWTIEDVELSNAFFQTHNIGYTKFPFPKDLFIKFIKENDGYFPIKLQSLPEGSIIYPHVPVYQIIAENEYSRLVTYLETILTMVWYPSTVATLSRRSKTIIQNAFNKSVDEDSNHLLLSRLHDFGFRGCTCIEQSIIGGCAHLLNFDGTDTLTAAYYAQYKLNNGKPVATSIPATEHSIMTSYRTEREAIIKLLENYGSNVCACVMDSYDYINALDNILPSIAKYKLEKGGFLILRPDSGNQIDVVIQGLQACEKVFGYTLNKKGYKVINGAGIIQGDAVTYESLGLIENAVLKEGYSAQCVAFGMGGGLLQRIDRDKMSFATKLCKIIYNDNTERDVMKRPKTSGGKISLPGEFIVSQKDTNQPPLVYPIETKDKSQINHNILHTIYDHGKPVNNNWLTFDQLRTKIDAEWNKAPQLHDPISSELKTKISNCLEAM